MCFFLLLLFWVFFFLAVPLQRDVFSLPFSFFLFFSRYFVECNETEKGG